ncbi:hypothetical protein ES319_D01G228700v1 [Gossypium barbadense]|uniref:Uncharacterized protein n=2 Tax=Gossypium TaxID=3633 RepID=A0A5J5SUD8_GOSBA|nr:hypothetical protein ES319_D01G228700v1 [Gossypium barbadense]
MTKKKKSVAELKEKQTTGTETVNHLRERLKQRRQQLPDIDERFNGREVMEEKKDTCSLVHSGLYSEPIWCFV